MTDSTKPSLATSQQSGPDDASKPEDRTFELARRFLDDPIVKAASLPEKREFLKGKGFDDTQITQLLEESPKEDQSSSTSSTSQSQSTTESPAKRDDAVGRSETETKEAPPPYTNTDNSTPAIPSAADNPPPIVTYPEFLTTPRRPPPLITPSRLANIVTISGGVWALFYGIAGLAVRPMADTLNESRTEYYGRVNEKLARFVEKLEGAASEVPYKNWKVFKSQKSDGDFGDNESVSSDPTELFHRDIGTQTSPPASTTGSTSGVADSPNEKPVDVQARRLSAISSALRDIGLMHIENAASRADLRSKFEDIQGHLDKLAYPPVQDFSTYSGLGYGQSTEPDDEFKKTKDAIRSVKGLLLSSRSFPVVATR
ncbi:peroxisomal membrane anchor protein conserved region-domain-containing protein [Xylaria sp. CBS 124048]|nr:peroxisomal membrane anchor protein conserved region-domain-containing protein [Xylaria sp. CBS 124048]